MTTAAIPLGVVPPRPALHSLLWIVPITALWTLLIYWQPTITGSGVPTTAVRLMTYGLIAVGLWLGLESTNLTPGQRSTTWLAVMVPYTLWAAVAWSAAISGVLRAGALPLAVLPGVFGLPAGIGDVLTGLFAVPAAIAVATGTAEGRKAAIIWNIFGLADFAVAITLGLITSPGRFQLIVPDVPNIGASAYPNVLTPAFVVPSSILLHALSLRQLVRRRAS